MKILRMNEMSGYGNVLLTLLDREELSDLNTDSIVVEWLKNERIKIIKDNQLWVKKEDKEVLNYFDEHYGFIDSQF